MTQLRLKRKGHANEHNGQNCLGDDTGFVEAHLETFSDVPADYLDGLEGRKHPGGKKSGQASCQKHDRDREKPEHRARVHAECHRNSFGTDTVEIGNDRPGK